MRTQLQFNNRNKENDNEVTVMVVYDDLAAGRWAGEVFSSFDESQIDDLHFRLQPWRVDFLADPAWAEVAAAEAREAVLLVVSMSHPSELPAAVERWLRVWLSEKRGASVAVVVLVDNENDTDAASRLAFLRGAAKEAHLNFFSVQPPTQETLPCFIPASREALSYRTPYRHWGLNE